MNTTETKTYNADEARKETNPYGYKDAMLEIDNAIRNQENMILIHPTKFLDENLKDDLMKKGYKISLFTDGFCGLQGLLIEW